jgi:hypothetical protein
MRRICDSRSTAHACASALVGSTAESRAPLTEIWTRQPVFCFAIDATIQSPMKTWDIMGIFWGVGAVF